MNLSAEKGAEQLLLSIVIPIYNEEAALPELYRRLTRVLSQHFTELAYEIVFVNDGSTDGSVQTLIKLHADNPAVKVVNLSRNNGDRDVATSVGLGNDAWPLCLIGVRIWNSLGFCLNETPPWIGLVQVVDRFRVRWEVELSIGLGKWVHRLDAITAERPYSVKALLQTSLISALLAHTHNVQTRPPQAGEARTEAPLYPSIWPCSSPSHASQSRGPSMGRGPRPCDAVTILRWRCFTLGEIPTGAVGRRS